MKTIYDVMESSFDRVPDRHLVSFTDEAEAHKFIGSNYMMNLKPRILFETAQEYRDYMAERRR